MNLCYTSTLPIRRTNPKYFSKFICISRSITRGIHSNEVVPHVIQAQVKRAMAELDENGKPCLDIAPKKVTFDLSEEAKRTIFFAETALGDEIVACDIRVLEFKDFGKEFIVRYVQPLTLPII